MQRLLRLSLFALLLGLLATSAGYAQQVFVSGRIAPGDVRVFVKDSTYIINRDYVVGGTLIIEPGTEIYFYPNGRLIDSTGGRIIADGFAMTDYNANPDGINPIATPGSPSNPQGFDGYSDLDYFLYEGTDNTVDVDTDRDPTVHPSKENIIFNVKLDIQNRVVRDFPLSAADPNQRDMDIGAEEAEISYEEAIMFYAARLYMNPDDDVNLRIRPWQRLGAKEVPFDQSQIRFIGQKTNNFSREWGHIIVLPGARAAFFRNCSFEEMRKDTTVDRLPLYDVAAMGPQWVQINERLNQLTNGAGGAITTFSSRTWLLNCDFVHNMARYRGGALQILQAPHGYPMSDRVLDTYTLDKNPNITDKDGTTSEVLEDNPILAIDYIDENMPEPFDSDFERQAFDDGRIAVYLGRMRNLNFDRNFTQLANVGRTMIGTPPVEVVTDLEEPADFPNAYGNHAFGGAIYIAGAEGDPDRQLEIGLGVNNSIMIGGEEVEFDQEDTFDATDNMAVNFQDAGASQGARGGALYVGRYTSLIVAGNFTGNETDAVFMDTPEAGFNAGYFSMGGAIFCENTLGRLQVRGGPRRDMIGNPTEFIDNFAGAGGAIYVDGNTDPRMSPIIGGSDDHIFTRDYGFNVTFESNEAVASGGAIFGKRHMTINGAGGVEDENLIGYGGNYPIKFLDNTAGFSGGAIDYHLPNATPLPASQRIVQIVRALFEGNEVGADVTGDLRMDVRGGGAIYALNADLNVVKGVEFTENMVYNGNGGAIAMVHPTTSFRRFFVSDLDEVYYDANGVANWFTSNDDVMAFRSFEYPPDARMLTRFLGNEIEVDDDVIEAQSGTGTTQIGKGTMPLTDPLYATAWVDMNTGFAVGYNGVIVKFEDGGDKWTYQNSGTNFRLNDVFFTNAMTGYVVGDRGVILKTTDGGANWIMMNSPTASQLNGVTFASTQVGYAVGDNGIMLKTTDAGMTWSAMQPQTNDLNDVYFTGLADGFAVGERGTILTTIDGGMNWDIQFIPGLATTLNDVFFQSASTGYIVGDLGAVIRTEDGGDTWDIIDADVDVNLHASYFTDQNTGYIAGDFGMIKMTNDGGDTWAEQDAGEDYNLYDAFFVAIDYGYVVGAYGYVAKTENAGADWEEVNPTDTANIDVVRFHPEVGLPENGVGLGGAIYLLDVQKTQRVGREDTLRLNRVRMQDNMAFTGAAIYSDNFDLKLIFNRSLVTGNVATSEIGWEQNRINGPVSKTNGQIESNFASSDLAGAILYGEVQGPLPSFMYSEAANSIYNNSARFLIRLPDAPNTKGVLAGQTGIGFGGTDTLRGNYWGLTEANVDLLLENQSGLPGAVNETFFVNSEFNHEQNYLTFVYDSNELLEQGPFESLNNYSYEPIPLRNGTTENEVGTGSLDERALMSGLIYDIYDKGTDVKAADYSNRRMCPIEDFAVGIPPVLRRFDDPDMPSNGKYVKRWTRDPEIANAVDGNGDPLFPDLWELQDEFRKNDKGEFFHPIGYPVYLETMVNYDGLIDRSNHDPRLLNETVFFVINEMTGDYIRVNLRQAEEEAEYRENFRARVELVPDSSFRNPNTLMRRTSEGLLNLGTGFNLLNQIRHNAYKEDQAALPGRKYDVPYLLTGITNSLGKVDRLLQNRPEMPASNDGRVTYFAGERYGALPVDTGDVVRVISRTVLWREGEVEAYDDGISFKVVRSTVPPQFTGNVVSLQKDTIVQIGPSEYPWKREQGIPDTTYITELLHKIYVYEDREYPQEDGYYSDPDNLQNNQIAGYVGRDSILTITAIDLNRFLDPRAINDPENYSEITYRWYVNPNSGLARWLLVDHVPADHPDYDNPLYGANGYLLFRGMPINPYVVPGGEDVTVIAENYPPHYRVVDSLRQAGYSEEEIDLYVETFKEYLNTPEYDITNARYLQQDTINFGSDYMNSYQFKIFVTDSVPRVIPHTAQTEEVYRRINMQGDEELYVTYEPSVVPCGTNSEDKFIANLTDKLRFQIDINTDDELEDAAAVNWDFRYGKTSYGFHNQVIYPQEGDTVVVDTTVVRNEQGEIVSIITQMKPQWMNEDFFYSYDEEDPTFADPYGIEFQTQGIINVRIDEAQARALLTPSNQQNGALNTDTLFTVAINDGHNGLTKQTYEIFINVQPEITTTSLPAAIEDTDYNPGMNDEEKMINVFDPNFGQTHRFELVYEDYPLDEIPIDPCFDEAGTIDLTGLKTTPEWLRINEESGLLYGTPGVDDAPKTEQITVIVWDEDDLVDVRTYTLTVEETNHDPELEALPITKCVDEGRPYTDSIRVYDKDLLGDEKAEEITVTVIEPTGGVVSVRPGRVTGPLDEPYANFEIYSDDFSNVPRDPDGKVTIVLEISDGETTIEREYRLRFSDETDFICPLYIENSRGSFEILEWGIGVVGATTGDGFDGEAIGHLDEEFCEYELPPLPQQDIFDARWNIQTTNGTIRNIFPRPEPGQAEKRIFRGMFQPGGVNGQTSPMYPITITWNLDDVPAVDETAVNPTGSVWYLRDASSDGYLFSVNMHTGDALYQTGSVTIDRTDPENFKVVINQPAITDFVIVHDWANSVEQPVASITETAINGVTPNPVNETSTVRFSVVRSGNVSIDVVDDLGKVVATVTDAYYPAGEHTVQWDARDYSGAALANGHYTIRLVAGTSMSAYPVVVVK